MTIQLTFPDWLTSTISETISDVCTKLLFGHAVTLF